jgi:hypothetical protein
MSTVFFHKSKQELIPVGVEFDNIANINNYTNNSIDKILIQDLLDCIEEHDKIGLLKTLKQKLKIGGELEIQAVDLKNIGMGITFGDITSELAKFLLFTGKINIHVMSDIISNLIEAGYQITIKKYINAIEYYIVATNNE